MPAAAAAAAAASTGSTPPTIGTGRQVLCTQVVGLCTHLSCFSVLLALPRGDMVQLLRGCMVQLLRKARHKREPARAMLQSRNGEPGKAYMAPSHLCRLTLAHISRQSMATGLCYGSTALQAEHRRSCGLCSAHRLACSGYRACAQLMISLKKHSSAVDGWGSVNRGWRGGVYPHTYQRIEWIVAHMTACQQLFVCRPRPGHLGHAGTCT